MSHEYIGAVAILLVSILKIAGIEIENDVVSGLLVGIVALWIAVRRKLKGDIDILGRKA